MNYVIFDGFFEVPYSFVVEIKSMALNIGLKYYQLMMDQVKKSSNSAPFIYYNNLPIYPERLMSQVINLTVGEHSPPLPFFVHDYENDDITISSDLPETTAGKFIKVY